jgi:tungstate transport system ATP-binding protein
MPAQPLYQVCDLEHRYQGRTVLRIPELTVPPECILGLIGPNGSGKSTLLRLLGFVEAPFKGRILFRGSPAEPFAQAVRFKVALLEQTPYLLQRTVARNVAFGMKLRGDGDRVRERTAEALSRVGMPVQQFGARQWNELSGGEAHRVALAARLALQPQVLLLDEPTAGVDAASAERIKAAALKARREWGTSLVIASHDWQWLYEVCDEVLHLFQGRLIGTQQKTLLFGPWQRDSNGFGIKVLADGQVITVSTPPLADAVALCDPSAIALEKTSPPAGKAENVLRGRVSRLFLVSRTGAAAATVLVADVPFVIGLTRHQVECLHLFPGSEVTIRFAAGAVEWLDEG